MMRTHTLMIGAVVCLLLSITSLATAAVNTASPDGKDGAIVVIDQPTDDRMPAANVPSTTADEGSAAGPGVGDALKARPDFAAEAAAEGIVYDGPPFVATDEWQIVAPGQSIPGGLHVAIDMQTGVKKAKLMEEQVGIKPPVSSSDEWDRSAAIKAAIKKHREGKGLDDSNGPSIYDEHKVPGYYNPDDANSTSNGEESADAKLKKYVGHLDMLKERGLSVQEDAVVMGKIVAALQVALRPESEVPDDDVIVFLEELTNFVHQVDNAVDFHAMGGLETISAYIAHPTRGLPLRAQAAVVMGTSAQNNPKATTNALAVDGMTNLLTLWRASVGSPALKRVLFSVTSVVQNSAPAYDEFVALGGVPLAAAVLAADPTADTAGCTPAAKKKVAAMVADLMLEQIMALHTAKHGEYRSPVMEGVDPNLWLEFAPATELAQLLAATGASAGANGADAGTHGAGGWCHAAAATLVAGTGRDMQDSLLRTMLGVSTHCVETFATQPVAKVVAVLRTAWAADYAEDPDDFSKSFVLLIEAVARMLARGTDGGEVLKDEL